VKLYCPNCCDIYTPASSRFQSVDGAFFGTTFAHLFLQTYREFAPAPFCQPTGNTSSTTRSPSSTPNNSTGQPTFVNPNPHGGQKKAFGRVYTPRIYGFKVSELAKSGPRMRWLRLRPESLEELDHVDWRGRWLSSDEEYDDDDEEEEDGELEDFDPDAVGEDEEDEEEDDDEEDDATAGASQRVTNAAPVKRRAEPPAQSRQGLRPPTPIHASASPPGSSSVVTSPHTSQRVAVDFSNSLPMLSGRGAAVPTKVRVVRTVTTESHPKPLRT